MIIKWPEELNSLLREVVPGRTEKEIVEEVSRHGYTLTTTQVRCAKKRLKIQSNSRGKTRGKDVTNCIENRWPGIVARLAEIAPGRTHKEIAEMLTAEYGAEFTPGWVNSTLKRNKIKTGHTGKFEKGNKVIRPDGYVQIWTPAMLNSRFKKGHRPAGWTPVGTERQRGDGTIWWKVAEPNKWRQAHRVVWEEHTGEKIPTGYAVIHLDGDPRNLKPENLACISKSMLMKIAAKGHRVNNAEIMTAAIRIEELNEKIRTRRKKENETKRTSSATD